jgi:hypothetical protein
MEVMELGDLLECWWHEILGYKRYACLTCVPHDYLHPHKYLFDVLQRYCSERCFSMCFYYLFNNDCLTFVT